MAEWHKEDPRQAWNVCQASWLCSLHKGHVAGIKLLPSLLQSTPKGSKDILVQTKITFNPLNYIKKNSKEMLLAIGKH